MKFYFAFAFTFFQVVLQPQAWKLWLQTLDGQAKSHEYKVCYGTLDGSIGRPWCYRLLSAWMVWLGHKLIKNLFFLLVIYRFIQNLLITYLFFEYASVYGTMDKMCASFFIVAVIFGYINTDFRLNTHNETILLLLSFLVAPAQPILLIPIALLAALNRETYGLFYLIAFPLWGITQELTVAFIVFIGVTLLIRRLVISDHLTCPQHTPGWGQVMRNLKNPATYLINAWAYCGLLQLITCHYSPALWLMLGVFAINFLANLWYGNLKEPALLLNPYLLILPLI